MGIQNTSVQKKQKPEYLPRSRNILHTVFERHFTDFCRLYDDEYHTRLYYYHTRGTTLSKLGNYECTTNCTTFSHELYGVYVKSADQTRGCRMLYCRCDNSRSLSRGLLGSSNNSKIVRFRSTGGKVDLIRMAIQQAAYLLPCTFGGLLPLGE